jgi:hypothetical protein
MVAVEKPLLRVLSVSSYLTRIAHAPYYIAICNLSGCSDIFTHYLINDTIFGNALPNIKCVFYLSLQLASEKNSHFKKNLSRYDHKCTYVYFESIGRLSYLTQRACAVLHCHL